VCELVLRKQLRAETPGWCSFWQRIQELDEDWHRDANGAEMMNKATFDQLLCDLVAQLVPILDAQVRWLFPMADKICCA